MAAVPYHFIFLAFASLLLGCGGPASSKARSDLLGRYVAAIEKDRPDDVYRMLGAEQRKGMSRQTFRRRWQGVRAELLAQAGALKQGAAEQGGSDARVIAPSGAEFWLSANGSRWRISRGYPQAPRLTTPRETILALLRAVDDQNLQAALGLFSAAARQGLEADLRRRMRNVREALDSQLEVNGDSAELRYGASGRIRLIRDNGRWRILRLD